jgi:hypothetical protein
MGIWGADMTTTWYRRVARFLAGPIAAAGVIGGAMEMSAIAHAHAGPPSAPTVVSHTIALRSPS